MSCQCFNQHSAPPGPKPAKCFFQLPPENAVTLIFSCLTPPARQPPAKHQILRTPPSVTTQLRCLSDLEDASHWPISLSMAACVPFGMPCALHLYGDIRSLPSPPLSPQLMEIASLDPTFSKNPSCRPSKYLWNDWTRGCVFSSQVCPTLAHIFLKLSGRLYIRPCLISLCWSWPSIPSYVNHLNLNMSCSILTIPAVGHLESFYFSTKSLTKMFSKRKPMTQSCGLPLQTALWKHLRS